MGKESALKTEEVPSAKAPRQESMYVDLKELQENDVVARVGRGEGGPWERLLWRWGWDQIM